METKVSNKTLTNVEMRELFDAQLNTGKPFIFHISEPSKGSDGQLYQQLYVAQERENNLEAEDSGDLDLNAVFLGWNTTGIYRAIRNAKPEIVQKMKLKVGSILDNTSIERRQSYEPFWAGQNPRQYGTNHPKEGESILVNGREVYEKGFLVGGEPKDQIIKEEGTSSNTVSVLGDEPAGGDDQNF